MISSGLNVPNPAIPIPALDVPNAAPTAEEMKLSFIASFNLAQLLTAEYHLHILCIKIGVCRKPGNRRLTAEATPAKPKNGAYGGHVDMI